MNQLIVQKSENFYNFSFYNSSDFGLEFFFFVQFFVILPLGSVDPDLESQNFADGSGY